MIVKTLCGIVVFALWTIVLNICRAMSCMRYFAIADHEGEVQKAYEKALACVPHAT
jgi:hypothetical protein